MHFVVQWLPREAQSRDSCRNLWHWSHGGWAATHHFPRSLFPWISPGPGCWQSLAPLTPGRSHLPSVPYRSCPSLCWCISAFHMCAGRSQPWLEAIWLWDTQPRAAEDLRSGRNSLCSVMFGESPKPAVYGGSLGKLLD